MCVYVCVFACESAVCVYAFESAVFFLCVCVCV